MPFLRTSDECEQSNLPALKIFEKPPALSARDA
jgi:hypothetical protein